MFCHVDSEDSDQTGQMQMPRLIWVFAGCTYHFVGFVMRRLICYIYREELEREENLENQKKDTRSRDWMGQDIGEAFQIIVDRLKVVFGPRHEKTCLRGLRPAKTQTSLITQRLERVLKFRI